MPKRGEKRPGRAKAGAATDERALGPTLSFLRVIWRVDHGLQRTSKRLEARIGITGPQRLVVRIVGRSPGITAGDLARVLHVHPSTLTGIIKRLEERKLVVRMADPNDGRRAFLRLSPAGHRFDVDDPTTVEAAVRRVLTRAGRAGSDRAIAFLDDLASELERHLHAD